MKNKQLAEMVKRLRAERLKETIGKPAEFDPEHGKADEDPNSPNQYAHRKHGMGEARVPVISGGAQGKSTLGNLASRAGQQRARGNQNQLHRFLGEKESVELGSTDTGKKSKSETEKIDVNPNIPVARGETTKNSNLTVKETKER